MTETLMQKQLSRVLLISLMIVGAVYYFYDDIFDLYQSTNTHIEKSLDQPKAIARKVITSTPLLGPTKDITSHLTARATTQETNVQRKLHGMVALSVNEQLTKSAELKVADMFAQQYFAHESPTGDGPGDLADAVGYEYIMVGENLALGNYEDDTALVEAWMNSPGHRENILNTRYTEIGVAVGRGTYDGHTVWLAVQEFGRPTSLCPRPHMALENHINENQSLLADLEEQLSLKSEEIENMRQKKRT